MLPNWRRRLGAVLAYVSRQRVEKLLPGRRDLRQQVLDKMTPADNPVARPKTFSSQMAIFRAASFRGPVFSRNNGKI